MSQFQRLAKALSRLRGWKNAIFADDNPQKNGIFPPLGLLNISRSLAETDLSPAVRP